MLHHNLSVKQRYRHVRKSITIAISLRKGRCIVVANGSGLESQVVELIWRHVDMNRAGMRFGHRALNGSILSQHG